MPFRLGRKRLATARTYVDLANSSRKGVRLTAAIAETHGASVEVVLTAAKVPIYSKPMGRKAARDIAGEACKQSFHHVLQTWPESKQDLVDGVPNRPESGICGAELEKLEAWVSELRFTNIDTKCSVRIECSERLGGLLRFYRRQAA